LYRAIEKMGPEPETQALRGRDVGLTIPAHRGSLLKFKLALNQNICTRIEVDDFAFMELLMNGETVFEANNVSLYDFLEELYKRFEFSRRNAIVGTISSGDLEIRAVIYRDKAGIALLSNSSTASCIEVLDMYMHVRGSASIYIVPGDIAHDIFEGI